MPSPGTTAMRLGVFTVNDDIESNREVATRRQKASSFVPL